MDRKQIIMTYSLPPSMDDLKVMAEEILDVLPDELMEFCEDVEIHVEDFPDEATEQDLDLEDQYELLCLYKSGKEISPGIEKKEAGEDDVLLVYRRPVLDAWCEEGDDLFGLLRQTVIEELGRHFDFSDDEIDEMAARHYQGML